MPIHYALIKPMKQVFFVLHFLLVSFGAAIAQSGVQDSLLKEIAFYSDVMVNSDLDQHRIRAHEQFLHSMHSLVSLDQSYEVSLDSIPWISVLHGDDLRIVTWQLRLSDEEYKYGGFIQSPDRLVELKDTRPWINGSLRNTYSPDTWYGAIYYKIIPFEMEGKRSYILFGFNAENSLLNTKVADVLDLSGKDPKFGMPVFGRKEESQTRLILTYSDASSVQLIFDPELNAIVHDHLENLVGVGPAGESLPVSDGSQEGWFLKEGKWLYEEEVYDIKSEVPPMTDDRKERKEDKDILGRPKKG